MMRTFAVGILLMAGCASVREDIPLLATGGVADDFETYGISRVGLMPLSGESLDTDHAAALQSSFYAEMSRTTPFEVVPLESIDLEEIEMSNPHLRGVYHPQTIIQIARRYRLDAVLFGEVIDRQYFPPQRISLLMDMVSAETGLVIWEASVHLDASDARVRKGLRLWHDADETSQDEWEVALLSPSRFASFAAWQVASLL